MTGKDSDRGHTRLVYRLLALLWLPKPHDDGGRVGEGSRTVPGRSTVITTLHKAGYYPHFVKPGEVELWAQTEAKSAVTVDVKAGDIDYVKGEVGVGFLDGRPHLRVVAREKGEKEISKCKLIPDLQSEAKK